jgi:hypothetical protein
MYINVIARLSIAAVLAQGAIGMERTQDEEISPAGAPYAQQELMRPTALAEVSPNPPQRSAALEEISRIFTQIYGREPTASLIQRTLSLVRKQGGMSGIPVLELSERRGEEGTYRYLERHWAALRPVLEAEEARAEAERIEWIQAAESRLQQEQDQPRRAERYTASAVERRLKEIHGERYAVKLRRIISGAEARASGDSPPRLRREDSYGVLDMLTHLARHWEEYEELIAMDEWRFRYEEQEYRWAPCAAMVRVSRIMRQQNKDRHAQASQIHQTQDDSEPDRRTAGVRDDEAAHELRDRRSK